MNKKMSIDNPRCCYCWSSKEEDEKENDNGPQLEKQREDKKEDGDGPQLEKQEEEDEGEDGNGHG